MKRIASILLLLAVVITTGCSKTEQTSASNTAESTTSNSTVENSSAETKVTEETEATEEAKEYSPDGIKCDPIDKTADCETILLEKADRLQTLIVNYLNSDTEKLAYKYGESNPDDDVMAGVKIISDEMSSYAEFKALFSDCIYEEYFDWINTHSLSTLFDVDGELRGICGPGGFQGTDETWYIGCDVLDDRIVGHFAELRGLGESIEKNVEYLNDESNYWFYDITVQNINGEYVITDCRETSSGKNYDYFNVHGLCYNSGFADRSLISNEKVMPKEL